MIRRPLVSGITRPKVTCRQVIQGMKQAIDKMCPVALNLSTSSTRRVQTCRQVWSDTVHLPEKSSQKGNQVQIKRQRLYWFEGKNLALKYNIWEKKTQELIIIFWREKLPKLFAILPPLFSIFAHSLSSTLDLFVH